MYAWSAGLNVDLVAFTLTAIVIRLQLVPGLEGHVMLETSMLFYWSMISKAICEV